MGETSSTVGLMWGASYPGGSAVAAYLVYRDGREIDRVGEGKTALEDAGLTANTQYRYFVAALDSNGRLSQASNVLTVTTKADQPPAWVLGGAYIAGQIVTNLGKVWRCLASHTADTAEWAPGATDGFTLWTQVSSRSNTH